MAKERGAGVREREGFGGRRGAAAGPGGMRPRSGACAERREGGGSDARSSGVWQEKMQARATWSARRRRLEGW